MRTLVIQSCSPDVRHTWIAQCLASVEAWSASCGFDYQYYGDEALQCTPDWYRAKLANRNPIVADLARLLLIRRALHDGYDQACWVDADVLLFAPDRLQLTFTQTCAFGRESWVTMDERGRTKVRHNVHNAICVFRVGCAVLPFLIHATQRIIRRVDSARISPQIVGPKLLSALHNIVGFDLIESVGAFSPAVIDELEQRPGAALAMLLEESPVALAGANLCASLNGERDLGAVCTRLVETGVPGQREGARRGNGLSSKPP